MEEIFRYVIAGFVLLFLISLVMAIVSKGLSIIMNIARSILYIVIGLVLIYVIYFHGEDLLRMIVSKL